MDVIEIQLSELKEYENNPRNNAAAVDAVAESIKKFGFKVPIIVDEDGVIVAGHTRKKAAERLGLNTAPCIIADDLTPEQIKAFRLADNKTGELASWDYEKLEAELAELAEYDMDYSMLDYGFSADELFAVSDPDMEEKPEKERGYSIVYELVFNDEAEQTQWYEYLGYLKRKYPNCETIAERVLCGAMEIMRND